MSRPAPLAFSRRLLVPASLLLGVFVLVDLGLFGWLIFRSLSQREIDEILLATRQEAEGLAEQIEGGLDETRDDLFTAVASERETLTYIDSMLEKRDVLQTLEIRNRDGVLVYRAEAEATFPGADGELSGLDSRELSQEILTDTRVRSSSYEVEVPIGDLGFITMGLSQGELERRAEVLRGHLLRQTGGIAVATALLLFTAYLVIWWLWRRGRQMEEKAAEAERMAYVGTLASGLAHEIRNPLNSLNLNMQMLEEMGEGTDNPSRGRLLAITRSEIGRLERLVTDFLTYARPRGLELEEVVAGELLVGVRELMEPQIEASEAEVTVDDRSGDSTVRVDPGMMRQLLINLLQNALQAASGGTRPARVRLGATVEGDCVQLEVEDNGPGIEPSDRQRVFDLFYSTRKGGTGLGLAVVDRIAQAHGGRLEVLDGAGGGALIRLSIPQSGSDAASSDPSASNSSSVRNCSSSSEPHISQKVSTASPASHSKM